MSTSSTIKTGGPNIDDNSIAIIRQIASTIRYGTITLVIQDGKLIQIDHSEKLRL